MASIMASRLLKILSKLLPPANKPEEGESYA
jgi:hypothetical protein